MLQLLKFRDLEKNHISLEVNINKQTQCKKTIDLKDVTEYDVLSISGDLREFTGGRPRLTSCGQIEDSIVTKAGPKFRLIKIWKRWHLNDCKSGTRKQEKCLNNWKERPKGWSYEEDCIYLKKHHLYNDRGYKYGQAWLVEPLPEDIIKEVEDLCNMIK